MKHVSYARRSFHAVWAKKSALVPLLAAALCFGCAGARVTSIADPTYDKAVNKLYILAELPEKGWLSIAGYSSAFEVFTAQAKDFQTRMGIRFEKISVNTSGAVKTGLELDESVYAKAMLAFEPDAVLLINCVSVMTKGNKISSAEFNVSLIDVASNKRFWRANISVNTGVAVLGPQPTGGLFADKIFDALLDQLKRDKLEIFYRLEPF